MVARGPPYARLTPENAMLCEKINFAMKFVFPKTPNFRYT